MKYPKYREALKAFEAISDGAHWEIAGTGFLIVENFDYSPDDGSNPNLVVSFNHDNLELYNGG